MMSAEAYNTISIIAFSLAGVFLVLSVYLFFRFRVYNIFLDLTGRNAKKSIEKMRSDNEKSGIKSFRPTPVAYNRGEITDNIDVQISENDELRQNDEPQYINLDKTEKLDYDKDGATVILGEGTEVLSQNTVKKAVSENFDYEPFKIIKSIVFIHTDEVI